MPVRAGWVPCVGIQPPKPEVVYIEEAATCTQECEGVLGQKKPVAQGSEFLEMNDVQQPKADKPPMKLVMNPKGVQDHTTVEQHYQQLMEQSNLSSANMSPGQMPASPEIVRDIITDMQSPTGKGAALFAKRKKRMDKFIVDETNVQKSSAYQQEQQSVMNTMTEKSTVNQFSSFSQSSTSSSSSSSTTQKPAGVLASSIPVSNKKKSLQERDKEQQRIMEDFMKNRESQFQIVKTPWEAVLETGNTSSAFKQNLQNKSSFSSTISAVSGPAPPGGVAAVPGGAAAPPSWLEMPQAVPVTAPMPKAAPSAPLPTPPSPFGKQTAGPAVNEGVGGTGLVYTAEVKVVQPSGQPKSQVFQPSAAPVMVKPAPPPVQAPSQPVFTAPAAAPKPAVTKPVPSPQAGGLGGAVSQGFVSQAEAEERRKSMNFNLAANGWGSYNKYYRPISFAS